MFSGSAPLRAGYLGTDYVIDDKRAELVIRVGRNCHSVDRLLSRFNARTAAFITASNPFSRQRGKIINEREHRRLRTSLTKRGLRFLEGEGRGAGGDWPVERSVLAFGIARATAASVGRLFRQNAIVFVRNGKPAELLMLR